MLSTLYSVEINTINYHIKKIYNDNELKEESTIRKFRTVQKKEKKQMDNKSRQITNHDFLIYKDSNNDIKVSVMLINNDINFKNI